MTSLPAVSAQSFSAGEMEEIVGCMVGGGSAEEDIAAFLVALAERGETAGELVGGARALRRRLTPITAPKNVVDCCGTGGDGRNTVNVSTAVAFVAAACGVPVAKHGNRAASGKSGAADVLEALGIRTGLSPESAAEALRSFNFAFLYAPSYHAAMANVAAARRRAGRRTIFNLLGPLANPAGAKRQLVGVGNAQWLRPMAEALLQLGAERALVVHGTDGLDEITVTGDTEALSVGDRTIAERRIALKELELPRRQAAELAGGDAATNARALEQLLDGRPNAYRDIVLANTAAVLALHDPRLNLRAGVRRAAEAIDSGDALHIMQRYRDFSQQAQ